MYDLLVKDGLVVDGTGNPWFRADIGIGDGKMASIGDLHPAEAEEVLDAKGLVVAPGFIDMHTHSELSLLINPRAESSIRQGVTTEVVGNCGSSAAPLNDALREEMGKTTPILGDAKLRLEWSTMDGYLKGLEGKGVAQNVVTLVGNGNLRAITMGFEARAPKGDELAEMKRALSQAMEDGAFGLSSGLIYSPSSYADTRELVELCRVVARYGGIYSSHIRGEGESLIAAVKEAIEIGHRSGVPVEISHHKASGRANWGKVKRTLKLIDEARGRGVDVTCDVYPYLAGSTGLDSVLPSYAWEGGVDRLIERLRDPETRRRLRREMVKGRRGWSSMLKASGWGAIMISYCHGHREYEGKTIPELARLKGTDPFDFVFDLLIEERASVGTVNFMMREEDLRAVLAHPVSMIGSDSSAAAPYGVLGKGKPHPRTYGTFPRVLGEYARSRGLLTLEGAVRKMTSLPAQKLKLRDRGLIREGLWADITVFDRRAVVDKATYAMPHRYPAGIEYVIVNGKIVIDRGEHTGALPGRALRLNRQHDERK